MSQNDDYIPAMGNFSLTFLYDPLMHLAMREAAFKGRLIEQARFGTQTACVRCWLRYWYTGSDD